jgi:hypothetical protein
MPVTCPNSRRENEVTYVASLTYCTAIYHLVVFGQSLNHDSELHPFRVRRGIANAQDIVQGTELVNDRASPSMKRNVITYVCGHAVEILYDRCRWQG